MFMVRKILVFVVLFLVVVAFSACKDDPVTPPEDHFEAIGVQISTSGIPVASILRGVTSDTLQASVGVLTDHYDIKFYDESENLQDPPSEDHYKLSWAISDTSLVEVRQHEGEEGGFEFHLMGKKSGFTDIEFFILHNNHSDFRSGKIPVLVN